MCIKKWIVKSYKKNEINLIGNFLKNQFNSYEIYEAEKLLRWKIVNNPICEGIINIIKDNQIIVSTTSVTPKKLFFFNNTYTVAEIGDTYTDHRYTRQGMFAQLINKSTLDALNKNINFIYGTPNNQSLPGYEKKASYKIISNLIVESLYLPVNVSFLMKNTLPIIGGWVGLIISYILQIRFQIYLTLLKLNNKNIRDNFFITNKIIDGFDNFWEESKQAYDFILSRDKKYFQWRFNTCPNNYTFLILQLKKKIIGYIVYRIKSNDIYKNLAIADYLFLPKYEKYLPVLILEVLKKVKKDKIDMVSVWCVKNNRYYNAIKKSGFMKRTIVPVISFQNNFSIDVNAKTKKWHFTMSDSDNI